MSGVAKEFWEFGPEHIWDDFKRVWKPKSERSPCIELGSFDEILDITSYNIASLACSGGKASDLVLGRRFSMSSQGDVEAVANELFRLSAECMSLEEAKIYRRVSEVYLRAVKDYRKV